MSCIYFVCPDLKTAAGGIKQIYRQVDVLNEVGYKAYVLHESPFFKCTWFHNNTKIVHSKKVFSEIKQQHKNYRKNSLRKILSHFIVETKMFLKNVGTKKSNALSLKRDDIFVFPEIYAFASTKVFPYNKKVIYNQNCYYTFSNLSLDLDCKTQFSYTEENTLATIVASQDAIDYLKYTFPGINLYRVHYGIDNNLFKYQLIKEKKIAFMPRKLGEDVIQVINIIKQREILNNWEFVEIDNMKENEVAEVLKQSAIFLSFNHREGFGMPPAEAMACGCVVIGYTGYGGKEYFKESFSYPIPDRDVQTFAKTLEQILREYDFDSKPFVEKGKKASEFILSEYTLEREKNDIVNVWNKILN